MKIPETFTAMNDQDRMAKVASSRIPLAMFSTPEQDVTLGINDNPMQWTSADTQAIYGLYKASLASLFDEIKFIQDEIRKINGREFIVFEFVSILRDDNAFSAKKPVKNYSYIQYTSYNNEVLLFNFGCNMRQKEQWETVARKIMESVRIK